MIYELTLKGYDESIIETHHLTKWIKVIDAGQLCKFITESGLYSKLYHLEERVEYLDNEHINLDLSSNHDLVRFHPIVRDWIDESCEVLDERLDNLLNKFI